MSTTNGQDASAEVLNAAYLSRTSNTSTVGILSLNHPSSGGLIANPQQQINDNKQNIKQGKFDATVDPVSSNDNTEGYAVGSIWVNVSDDKAFIAVDVATGAAVWKSLGGGIMYEVDQTYFNSSLTVDDSAYVELIADTGSSVIRKIQSFYAAGSVAEIAIGAATSEQELFILQPGGNGESGLEVNIPVNSRVSIRLKSGEAALSGAKLALNLFKEA